MGRLGLALIVGMVLSVSVHGAAFAPRVADALAVEDGAAPIAYLPHPPIVIRGDESALPLVSGIVGGNGTEEDPYLISGWDIQALPVDTSELPILGELLGDVAAISLNGTDRFYRIESNFLHDIGFGVELFDAPNVTVVNNLVARVEVGLSANGGGNIDVLENTFADVETAGVVLRNIAGDVTVDANTVDAPLGITALLSTGLFISDNGVDADAAGIALEQTTASSVVGNAVRGETGIVAGNSDGIDVLANTVTGAARGVELFATTASAVDDNTLSGNGVGVLLDLSSANSVVGNTITGSDVGVRLLGSSANRVSGNALFQDARGVQLDGSDGNIVSENSISESTTYGVQLVGGSDANVVDLNAISRGGTAVRVASGTANDIASNAIAQNDEGVRLDDAGNSATGNSIEDTAFGIEVGGAPGTLVDGNAVVRAVVGVLVAESPGTALTNNEVVLSDEGIRVLDSAGAVLRHNGVTDNGRGLLIERSAGSVVEDNSFFSNSANGIELVDSVGSVFHRNNFDGNRPFGLTVSGSGEVNAENNYWGSTTGPQEPNNNAGKGDKVSDDVDYQPYSVNQFFGAGPA